MMKAHDSLGTWSQALLSSRLSGVDFLGHFSLRSVQRRRCRRARKPSIRRNRSL